MRVRRLAVAGFAALRGVVFAAAGAPFAASTRAKYCRAELQNPLIAAGFIVPKFLLQYACVPSSIVRPAGAIFLSEAESGNSVLFMLLNLQQFRAAR